MRWSAGIIFFLVFVSTCVQAQQTHYGVIKGTVIDSLSHRPLESVSIRVHLASDSSLVNYALSDRKGAFTITSVPVNTKCKLVITTEGYDDFFLPFILSADTKEKRIDTIQLAKAYKELKAITITAQRQPVVVKQDTLEFNVSSFKTIPNAMVEDLLKQLPGLEIDKDGNLTFNGKKVTKLYLDGQEFFGGDPKIAIKNLPRDLIDKVQVMDNKSREARFNKTANGNEDLAINLTLKKDVQKGWSGRASAGYGSNERYEGNGIINFFKGSKQLNFMGNTNNTNRGSFSGDGFNITNASSTLNGGGGLTRASSGGVNFGDNIGRQLKLNGSYLYNKRNTDNLSRSQRKNNLPDTSFYYNADNSNKNTYTYHELTLNAQYNIDTLTELHITTYANANVSKGVTLNKGSSSSLADQLINTSENAYSTDANGKNISSELFFGHRFRKPGRSFTMDLNYNYNDMSSVNDNIGQNDYYKSGVADSTNLVNQKGVGKNTTKALLFTATYAEPLNKYITALFRYNYSLNTNFSDKVTNRFNGVSGKYDIEDSVYTNAFRNITEMHNPDVSISFNKNKYQVAIGSGLQFLQQDNVTVTTGALLHQYYINFTPSANLQYNLSKTGNVTIFYNGRSEQPSIQQLQPVPDNSNPLYVQLGNPDLRSSFLHSVFIQVRESRGSNYLFAGFDFKTTRNQIINETWFDDVGKQISRPINVNGNYSILENLHYRHTWNKRDLTLSIDLSSIGNFNKDNSFVNKDKIMSNSYSLSQSIGLNFMYKQLVNVMPSFNIGYNKTHYSSASMQDVDFNTKSFSVSAFWNYPKRLIVENNLQYNYTSQIAAGFSKNVTRWSAALDYLLFKNQQGMLRLAVYDILKQNAGVYRSITPTYTEDRQIQVLQRYFLISLIYNFKKK